MDARPAGTTLSDPGTGDQAGAPLHRRGPTVRPVASEATRYLCAGVHSDRGAAGRRARRLRKLVAEQVLEDPARAIGVSPGVDLRPVVVNCRAAERRLLLRDIVLSILAVAFLVLPTVLEPAAVIWVVLLLLAAEVIYAEAVVSTWGVTARRFVRGSFDPQEELDRGASMRDVLAQVAQAQDGNVTVYSGFSPFVGAGFDVGGWSFALNISRGRERFGTVAAPRRFELTELYEHVSGAIDSLGLSGLSIEDRLYVDGRELRRDGLFLDAARARPLTMADPATVGRFVGGDAEAVRHYKTIRVTAWGGELVLSIFLRFSVVQHCLFAEASYFLLTPIEDALHRVDELHARPTWGQRGRLALEATALAPVRGLAAPFKVLGAALGPPARGLKRRRIRREVARNAAFDHGARTSIRDSARSPDVRQYFQKLDREMYAKVVERELFDSIVEFLEEHDIDSAELRQRETTVLNNGVIVTGGSIQAQSMAVGDRARAFVDRATGARDRAAATAGRGKGA